MTANELRAWMASNEFSVRALARELDVAPSSVQDWRDGVYPVSRRTELALRSLE